MFVPSTGEVESGDMPTHPTGIVLYIVIRLELRVQTVRLHGEISGRT